MRRLDIPVKDILLMKIVEGRGDVIPGKVLFAGDLRPWPTAKPVTCWHSIPKLFVLVYHVLQAANALQSHLFHLLNPPSCRLCKALR